MYSEEKYHEVESFYGQFSRTFVLPVFVDADAITAEAKEGTADGARLMR